MRWPGHVTLKFSHATPDLVRRGSHAYRVCHELLRDRTQEAVWHSLLRFSNLPQTAALSQKPVVHKRFNAISTSNKQTGEMIGGVRKIHAPERLWQANPGPTIRSHRWDFIDETRSETLTFAAISSELSIGREACCTWLSVTSCSDVDVISHTSESAHSAHTRTPATKIIIITYQPAQETPRQCRGTSQHHVQRAPTLTMSTHEPASAFWRSSSCFARTVSNSRFNAPFCSIADASSAYPPKVLGQYRASHTST